MPWLSGVQPMARTEVSPVMNGRSTPVASSITWSSVQAVPSSPSKSVRGTERVKATYAPSGEIAAAPTLASLATCSGVKTSVGASGAATARNRKTGARTGGSMADLSTGRVTRVTRVTGRRSRHPAGDRRPG